MPNDYNRNEVKSTGIVENNRVYNGGEGTIYTTPTDWSIWMVYNPKFGGGVVKFKVWAEDINAGDVN